MNLVQKNIEKILYVLKCETGYAQYLRHLVEKMFPVELLNQRCSQPIGEPKGNVSIPCRKKTYVIQSFTTYNSLSQLVVGQ